MVAPALKIEPKERYKMDFGCGPHKKEGFYGVDIAKFPGVDEVVDLRRAPWPWPDGSVAEAHASHFVEHLTAKERIVFVNELYRVSEDGAKCTIIVPHWASCRAYGDPTHQWPPVSEFWFYYILKSWRMQNAPHTDATFIPGGFDCDFDASWGYSLRGDLGVKNQEFQQFAVANYKEVIQDIVATLTKRKPE
jgi:hypothetical protein